MGLVNVSGVGALRTTCLSERAINTAAETASLEKSQQP
jgi:hypothetical protein